MKKILLLSTAIIIMTMGNSALAQIKNNAIKIPIVGLFGGQYQLAYERAFSDKISMNLSGGYILRNSSQSWGSDSYEAKTDGFLVVPEVRYYFKEAIKGMYLAAFFRYKSTTQDLTDTSVPIDTDVSRKMTVNSIGGGIVFGGQFIIGQTLVIDMFIGPIFKNAIETTKYKNPGVTNHDFDSKFLDFKVFDKSPVGVRGGVSFGFAF